MKNVYYLAANIERDKFRLDVKYQSDTTGVLSIIHSRTASKEPNAYQTSQC